MPIVVRCQCGKVHRLNASHAGKRAKCRCGAVLFVPTENLVPQSQERPPIPAAQAPTQSPTVETEAIAQWLEAKPLRLPEGPSTDPPEQKSIAELYRGTPKHLRPAFIALEGELGVLSLSLLAWCAGAGMSGEFLTWATAIVVIVVGVQVLLIRKGRVGLYRGHGWMCGIAFFWYILWGIVSLAIYTSPTFGFPTDYPTAFITQCRIAFTLGLCLRVAFAVTHLYSGVRHTLSRILSPPPSPDWELGSTVPATLAQPLNRAPSAGPPNTPTTTDQISEADSC